jgi:hypothetical protein
MLTRKVVSNFVFGSAPSRKPPSPRCICRNVAGCLDKRKGWLLTASQGILECLLETEELEAEGSVSKLCSQGSLAVINLHGQVDRGVESKTTLVGAKSTVVLHTVTTVDLEVALVVVPGDTELDDTLGDGGDSEGGAVLGVLGEEGAALKGGGKLCMND